MKKGPFIAVFIMAALAAFPVLAASQQRMVYDVYASGVHVLEAQLDLTEENASYNMVFKAHTRGFLAALLPWQGTFETHGRLDSTYHPAIHTSHTVWRDEVDGKEYRYNKEGVLNELIVTEKGKTKKQDFDPELAEGTVDAYTGALKVLAKIAAGGACEGQDDIFDEKRRFTQIFHPKEKEVLQKTDYNVFSGPAAVCMVEVVPNGGKWHKKPRGWLSVQEQGRKLGALPTMWAAKMNATGPAVPVKIMVKTDYGTLFIHLAEYRNGDKIIKTKNRQK